jgi:hypothetical protein
MSDKITLTIVVIAIALTITSPAICVWIIVTLMAL